MTIKKTCAEFGIKNERREERCRKLRKLAKNMKGTNLWSKKKNTKSNLKVRRRKLISQEEFRMMNVELLWRDLTDGRVF